MRRPGHSHRRVERDQKTEPHACIERMGARGDRSRPANWSRRSEDLPERRWQTPADGAQPRHTGAIPDRTPNMRVGDMAICADTGRWHDGKHPQNTPRPSIRNNICEKKCVYATTRSQENTRKRLCVCHPNCKLCSSLSIAMSASILCRYSAQIVGQSQGRRRRDNPRSRRCQRAVAMTATADAREQCRPTERRG